MIIPQGDFEFLKFAMHQLGIHKPIKVMRSASKKKWPDIWCLPDKPVGEIWVTNEWAKQPAHERKKRLCTKFFISEGWNMGLTTD